MCERGVFRHELFDGTIEYHVCDSEGVIVVAHVASRVSQEFVEGRLSDFLDTIDPDGISAPASSPSLHLYHEAVA
jgi:hypothetical protein